MANREYYSPYKAVHHHNKISTIKRGKLTLPSYIEVGLTGRCNHNCGMCIFRNNPFPHTVYQSVEDMNKMDIPLEIIAKLANEMNELEIPAVEITGAGEPLCHPQIKEVLTEFSKYDIEVALVTNGAWLTSEILDCISNPKWIRISVDAESQEVHTKTHGTYNQDSFRMVHNGIKRAVDWAKEFEDVVIGCSFIIQEDNLYQIPGFTEMMKDCGVDNVRLAHEVTPKWDGLFNNEEKVTILKLLRHAKSFEDDDFKVFAMVDRLPSYRPEPIGVDQCGYQLFTASLSCDCLFYPCCVIKFNRDYVYGDLRNESLIEILFGDKRKNLIQTFPYNACEFCYLREKVQFIDYLCQTDPPHKNFI